MKIILTLCCAVTLTVAPKETHQAAANVMN